MANLDEIVLSTLYLDMTSNQCGYPLCCPGDQPKFIEVNFFPAQLTNCGIDSQVREFMREAGEIFHKTGMPMFPCVLHHFCLPFSPVCAMMYCASKRKAGLEELIKQFNHETALPIGLYLQWNQDYFMMYENTGRNRIVVPALRPGIEIKMNIPKRQEYCGKNGLLFDQTIPITGQPGMAPTAPFVPMMNPPPYTQDPYPPPGGFAMPQNDPNQPQHYIINVGRRASSCSLSSD